MGERKTIATTTTATGVTGPWIFTGWRYQRLVFVSDDALQLNHQPPAPRHKEVQESCKIEWKPFPTTVQGTSV